MKTKNKTNIGNNKVLLSEHKFMKELVSKEIIVILSRRRGETESFGSFIWVDRIICHRKDSQN